MNKQFIRLVIISSILMGIRSLAMLGDGLTSREKKIARLMHTIDQKEKLSIQPTTDAELEQQTALMLDISFLQMKVLIESLEQIKDLIDSRGESENAAK